MSDEAAPKNLRQKIVAAMADIGSIAKAGRAAEQQGGYAYQRAADIFPRVQEAFIKHGVMFLASEESVEFPEPETTKSGAKMFIARVTMRYWMFDTDQADSMDAKASGIGYDTSDKALNKARTAALKYFLKQTFLIGEDEDDSETDSHEVQAPACPHCGVVGSIIKGKAEYGGGWLCWKNKGGCGAKFATDPTKQAAKSPETAVTATQTENSYQAPSAPPASAPEPIPDNIPTEMPPLPEGKDGEKISPLHAVWAAAEAKAVGADAKTVLGTFAQKKPDFSTVNYGELAAIVQFYRRRRENSAKGR